MSSSPERIARMRSPGARGLRSPRSRRRSTAGASRSSARSTTSCCRPGGYVSIDGRLGQVHAIESAWVEGAGARRRRHREVADASHLRIALARGHGVVLDSDGTPIPRGSRSCGRTQRPSRAGSSARAPACVTRHRRAPSFGRTCASRSTPAGSTGTPSSADSRGREDVRARHHPRAAPPGDDRSGWSSSIRTRTSFGSREIRDGVEARRRARYREATADWSFVGAQVGSGSERLHVRFRTATPSEQAAVLRLDPIGTARSTARLVDMLESGLRTARCERARPRDAACSRRASPEVRALGARLRNLGTPPVARSGRSGDDGLRSRISCAPGGPRALVVDLGSLDTRGEKAIAAESVLAALWRRRSEREPVLIVIDEAHNVCPREPGRRV